MRTINSVIAVAALSLAAVQGAHAAMKLQLSDGTNTVTVQDGGTGDANAEAGVITFIGSLGGTTVWTINVATGISKPTAGATDSPKMDLNSVNMTSTGGGTLTISLTDTDFDMGASAPLVGTATIGGTSNGTVTSWAAYVDDANGEFATTELLASGGPASGGFSATEGFRTTVDGTFSLTQIVTVSHDRGGMLTSFDFEVEVPAPATLGLLGLGLLGLGLAGRRKAQQG